MARKTHVIEGEVIEVKEFDRGPLKIKIAGDAAAGFEKTETIQVWSTVFANEDKDDKTKIPNPDLAVLKKGAKVKVTFYNEQNGEYWNSIPTSVESLNGSPQNGSSGAVSHAEPSAPNIRSIDDAWLDGLLEAVSAAVVTYVGNGGGVSSPPAVSPKLKELLDNGISESLIKEKSEILFKTSDLASLDDTQATALASVIPG